MNERVNLQEGVLYRASLLDEDNRPLANGEARLRIVEREGVFLPSSAITQDIPKRASSLQIEGNAVLRIRNLRLCGDPWPTHYHFEYQDL
jgi:hypothetical protein